MRELAQMLGYTRLFAGHNERINNMKLWTKLLIIAGIVLIVCLSLFFLLREPPNPNDITGNTNDTTSATNSQQTSENAFDHVIRTYAALMQDSQWAEELYHMTEEQRRNIFAQDFEMLPENAFLSLNAYRFEDEGDLAYAFHDIDGNGTMALLLAYGWALTDIFIIHNDTRTQLISFYYGSENYAVLFSNGTIAQGYGFQRRFYRFEDGQLIRFATLVAGTEGENYYHILADGSEAIITRDQFNEISEELLGDGGFKDLAWRPLAEFGR